ncbi:MAG: class I SAM-dependent methyltransferase [Streptosporangiaceae bacterium]
MGAVRDPGSQAATRNPFAIPQGALGGLAGRIMARGNEEQQHEVLGLFDVRPGQRVLEVGHGPGHLVRLLLKRTGAGLVAGVDPSQTMLAQAQRANRVAVRAGRADLRQGTADRLPFDDASFDHVVSVNSCQIWPDLTAGLREAHRVLRPGGTIVLAVHSRSAPSRMARRIGLCEEDAAHISRTLARLFTDVASRDLVHSVAFTAVRGR